MEVTQGYGGEMRHEKGGYKEYYKGKTTVLVCMRV